MSIETWRKEFYPVPASDAATSDLEAARHSLRKWRGLRQEILEKHDAEVDEAGHRTPPISVDDCSCALCCRHLNNEEGHCGECPLIVLTGFHCGGHQKQWSAWVDCYNPEPMIEALEELVRRLEDHDLEATG